MWPSNKHAGLPARVATHCWPSWNAKLEGESLTMGISLPRRTSARYVFLKYGSEAVAGIISILCVQIAWGERPFPVQEKASQESVLAGFSVWCEPDWYQTSLYSMRSWCSQVRRVASIATRSSGA